MRDTIKKKLQYMIDSLDEASYRKGYSHGYYSSLLKKDHNSAETRAKMQAWTSDLNINTGAPGSFLENEKRSWTSISDKIFAGDELVLSILSSLTYNDENNERKKYNVYERELYRALYFLSKDSGYVLATSEKLAELCNMSTGSVCNAKKILCLKCNNTGIPMISIEEVSIKSETENGANSSICHKIKVNVI